MLNTGPIIITANENKINIITPAVADYTDYINQVVL